MRINDFFQRLGNLQQPSSKQIRVNTNIDQSVVSTEALPAEELLEGLLKEVVGKPSPNLKEVLKQYLSGGKSLNKEMVQLMDQIMQKGEGTPQQKQEIFRLMAQKNIPISMNSYKAIYQALNGPTLEMLLKPLSDVEEMIPVPTANLANHSTKKLIQKLNLLINMIKDHSFETSTFEKQITELQKEISLSQLSSNSKEKISLVFKEMIGTENSTHDSMDQSIKKDSVSHEGNSKTAKIESPMVAPNKETPTDEPSEEQPIMVEKKMKPELVDKMEVLLKEMQQNVPEGEFSSVQSATFTRVMEFIPQHLRQVGKEFTEIKKQVIQNIDRMTQFIDQKIPQAESYVKRVIEPTIDMVNRLINKGEFALHADMEFEHDVLRISSELQKVKGMLDQGDQKKACEVFQVIRKDLEKLEWQPSIKKVESFFSKWTGDQSTHHNPLESFGQDWKKGELSGRGVQEWMRDLGLNHERDVLDFLIHRNKKEEEQPVNQAHPFSKENPDEGMEKEPPRNMKAWLMENMEKEIPAKAKQVMEQALSNVTGQQLLTKSEPNHQMQTMYVQLPLPWEDRTRSVKMEIHSRSQGEKMDWENCHLFFYLDTPKFGETGISVQVANRDITLKFQNDHQGVESFFTPFIPKMKDSLQGIGYRINKVQFETIQQDEKERDSVKKSEPNHSKTSYPNQKGLDLSI